MARKSIGDILGIGLTLQAIFIIAIALRESSTILKSIGFTGSIIILIAESFFLWRFWNKDG